MIYKRPSVSLEFCMSTFEQVQPSVATLISDYEYGWNETGRKVLTRDEKRHFIKLAIDRLEDELRGTYSGG